MAQRMVNCVRLGRELPGIDEDTPDGQRALKMCRLVGGRELADRVRDKVSMEAWKQWVGQQVMVINEYRLDPTSDAANPILLQHMEAFLFGEQLMVDNYVPPDQRQP